MKEQGACKSGYGEHDFCVINTDTGVRTCCNCGKEKQKSKWIKEFETTLGNLNYYDEGVTLEEQGKEVFYLGELIKKYLKTTKDDYRGEIIKVKIKCKNGCIQIERIGQ